MKFDMTVYVFNKPDCLNPEEPVIASGLQHLGFSNVSKVRKGTCIIVTAEADSEDAARQSVTDMCKKLLANLVTSTFKIVSISPAAG